MIYLIHTAEYGWESETFRSEAAAVAHIDSQLHPLAAYRDVPVDIYSVDLNGVYRVTTVG